MTSGMTSSEIRSLFIDYFKKHGHTQVDSSPLVPQDDATLLFANAGMNQFKNTFTGLEPRSYKRAVSAQKCVRAGGKHNDLENVGFTARHHTFFEMMGNFSFGDYFKKDAIHFAWDFLTNILKIDKDKLFVTVHVGDDEADKIWQEQEKVPASRIFRFDDDNYWRMGDVGPCGPCSEIFFDHGPAADPTGKAKVGGDEDRYVEIWNLVFMQYNEDKNGKSPLPNPSIDTGAGLERLAAVMQGQPNNYDTDVFSSIIERVEGLSGLKYDLKYDPTSKDLENLASMRVLADHARASAFLISDGVLPSNEGRGYVLRRIMRRGLRYGRKLSEKNSFLPELCKSVIESMADFYPELRQKESLILSTAKDEEGRFLQTLDQGTQILSSELSKLEKKGIRVVSGETVFKLCDTYGFPQDLTRLMAAEKGFTIDETGFSQNMEKARTLARASWKGQGICADATHLVQLSQKVAPTEFTGYQKTEEQGQLLVLSKDSKEVSELGSELSSGESGIFVTDKTCFYAESGGQVGDCGIISTATASAEVLDCTKTGDVFFHHVKVTAGVFKKSDSIKLSVSSTERRETASNHSATHLLHAALRDTLGDHVTQAGSLVDAGRLRFDFTHGKALSFEQIVALENWVNKEVLAASQAQTILTDPKSAIEKEGALALFGEKYGDEVRVVKMGPNSAELCGGIHVNNTAEIQTFMIVSEAGVSAGVRRIEAVTGRHALQFMRKHVDQNLQARALAGIQVPWNKFLDSEKFVSTEIEKLNAEIKTLRKDLFAAKGSQINLDDFIKDAKEFTSGGETGRLVTAQLETDDRKMLTDVTDKLKNKVQSGVIIMLGKGSDTNPIIISVTKNLLPKINAGKILKEVASVMGGKGGGRPDFAQGAVADLSKAQDGFEKAASLL